MAAAVWAVEMPALEAAVEGGGAELEGKYGAAAIHDLPEPDEHFFAGLGHEEKRGRETVAELGDVGETGPEMGRAEDDFR